MEIREFKEGDKSKILDLFKISFGKAMSEYYWDWRFLNNPFFGEMYIHLMFENDKLIGHYAVSPIEMVFNGIKKKTALSMTTMTHPDYSGRGIFSKLAASLYEKLETDGYEMVWGFPNNNSHYGFNKNLGWKDLAIVPMLKLDAKKNNLLRVINCIKISEVETFIVDLMEKEKKIVRINKSLRYLEWRYKYNPTANYLILKTVDNEAFLIYKVVASFNNLQKFEIDIMEIFVPTIEHLSSLLTYLVELNKDAIFINIWDSIHSDNHLLLEKLGFRHCAPLTYLGARSLNGDNLIFNFNNWDLSFGYSDVF